MARYPMNLVTSGSLLGASGYDPFLTLHREMNRLFDDVARSGAPASSRGGQGGALLAPHMDVSETDKEVRIQAELPGVSERDVEVALDDDVLTIRAEKKQERREEREGIHLSERAYGTFQRSLRLPFHVDAEQVQARFDNGVLSVTLPKTQPQERTRRVQIQSGPKQAQIERNQAVHDNGGGQNAGRPGGSAAGSATATV